MKLYVPEYNIVRVQFNGTTTPSLSLIETDVEEVKMLLDRCFKNKKKTSKKDSKVVVTVRHEINGKKCRGSKSKSVYNINSVEAHSMFLEFINLTIY